MELSGYYMIHSNIEFKNWIGNPMLMAEIIQSDIQTYIEGYLEKEFKELDGKKILSKLNILIMAFKDIENPNKAAYKKVYLQFIKQLIREHHTTINRKNDFEDVVIASPIDDVETREKEEERRKKLDKRYEIANLSTIEKSALNYIRDRKQKHKLLEHFTLNGIFQLANRAALKLIFSP